MYYRGMVVASLVASYDSSMKAKPWNSYAELTEKDPNFVWPRENVRNMKDLGNIEFNIPYPEFIADPTH